MTTALGTLDQIRWAKVHTNQLLGRSDSTLQQQPKMHARWRDMERSLSGQCTRDVHYT